MIIYLGNAEVEVSKKDQEKPFEQDCLVKLQVLVLAQYSHFCLSYTIIKC